MKKWNKKERKLVSFVAHQFLQQVSCLENSILLVFDCLENYQNDKNKFERTFSCSSRLGRSVPEVSLFLRSRWGSSCPFFETSASCFERDGFEGDDITKKNVKEESDWFLTNRIQPLKNHHTNFKQHLKKKFAISFQKCKKTSLLNEMRLKNNDELSQKHFYSTVWKVTELRGLVGRSAVFWEVGRSVR